MERYTLFLDWKNEETSEREREEKKEHESQNCVCLQLRFLPFPERSQGDFRDFTWHFQHDS